MRGRILLDFRPLRFAWSVLLLAVALWLHGWDGFFLVLLALIYVHPKRRDGRYDG